MTWEASAQGKTRRHFIKQTAIASLALGTRAWGQNGPGANDAVGVGILGTGDRGQWLLAEIKKQGAQIVALADINQDNLEKAKELALPQTRAYEDYQKVLERKDVDAVFIASPDHWHYRMTLDALAAGKDVYVEKPLSRTIEEGQGMVKAVLASKQVVQVGTQKRSEKHWQAAKEVVQSGQIGKIKWIRTYDCRDWSKGDPYKQRVIPADRINWEKFLGTAPKRDFDPVRYSAWRWYWDYAGGLMTNIGIHYLDMALWVTSSQDPTSFTAGGGKYHFSDWETPDLIQSTIDCGSFSIGFASQLINGHDGIGMTFYGTEGTMVQDRYGDFKVYKQADTKNPAMEWKAAPTEGPPHIANFLDCVRTRNEPNAPIQVGHRVTSVTNLCNMAYREGRKIVWDWEKGKVIV